MLTPTNPSRKQAYSNILKISPPKSNLRADFQQDALPQFPWLPFGCYRRKKVYLLNVWRPIVHAPGMLVWTSSTNGTNFSLIGWKTDELLGVKISGIPYQLWTAYLSLIRPSPIWMKLVPDERSGPMTHWGQVPKNSYRPFFMAPESWYLLMFDP